MKAALAALAAAPLCSRGKDSAAFCDCPLQRPASARHLQMKGKWERRGRKGKKPTTHTHTPQQQQKNHITADQMGTFHMTKPINHLGGAQVQHSRVATHHFTVYRAQTHGHQSMAPPGPGGEALSSLTGPCLMTS